MVYRESMRKNLSILFVYPSWAYGATFVRRDFDILSKHYNVSRISYMIGDRLFPLRLLKHFTQHSLCFVWFGGIHAFWTVVMSKLLRKKCVIVAGGYDAVYLPEIGYGIRAENKGWRRTYYSFRSADKVLAVSRFIVNSLENECRVKNNIELTYNAIETDAFRTAELKERIVLTVGNVNKRNLIIKGLKNFVLVAQKFSDVKFILIGGGDDEALDLLKSMAPSNVEFTGSLPIEETKKYMQKAKVYVQLSAQESFCCALAEAMLCECIPVVTNRGALSEVAGPEAFYVEYGDIEGTVKQINQALAVDSGSKYRKRIIELFPIEQREKQICEIIDSLVR